MTAADELFRRERVVVVVKLITGTPDEEEWRTGYDAVSQTTEKQRFDTHRVTVTVVICPYNSLAVFTVEIQYGAARRRGIDHRL